MSISSRSQFDGLALRRHVLEALHSGGHPDLDLLHVDVDNGCVLVSGSVSSPDAKLLAQRRVCSLSDVDAARFEISVTQAVEASQSAI